MCDILLIYYALLIWMNFPTIINVLGQGWGQLHALLLLLFIIINDRDLLSTECTQILCWGMGKNHTPYIQKLNIQTKIFNIKYRFK